MVARLQDHIIERTIRRARDTNEQLPLERAAEPGVVYGSKAVGEPPLMLAFAAREALRAAVAAFATAAPAATPPAGSASPAPIVELASPATPEAVYWAIESVRARSRAVAEPHAAQ